MSEVVKEAADVVLLQPATEKPGLHEDLSLHTEIDCDASGCPGCLRLPPAVSQVQIQMRQPFISAHLLHAPRPVTFLAHPGPITAHFRDDVSSNIKNVPDAYIDRCRLGNSWKLAVFSPWPRHRSKDPSASSTKCKERWVRFLLAFDNLLSLGATMRHDAQRPNRCGSFWYHWCDWIGFD